MTPPGRRRTPPPGTPTLWSGGRGSKYGQQFASEETPVSARRRSRVVNVVQHGACTAAFRGRLSCRLKMGHHLDGIRHEANQNLSWPPIPPPSCGCGEFTPMTPDGLVLACASCGEIVWAWPPPELEATLPS